eukprot:TRINITY_DN652_c0_g2_i1.p1 TRINITY_DN652_c0_g2~~TRINITY_DN652_c0_g2_i1.p1  ORF type:complete len:449 (-),score=68.19 TRINITY_DN652_c0_g2_i1:306-1625(-)
MAHVSGADASEVPKCHLHKKQNKACKFCKAFYSFQEQKQAEEQNRKEAETLRLKGELNGKVRSIEDTLADPCTNALHPQLKRKIEEHSLYKGLENMGLKTVWGILEHCCSCELESDSMSRAGSLIKVKEPSEFICSIYSLMTRKLTRADLDSMLNSKFCYLRCAACLYIRLVMHPEHFWDLLSPYLMDTEPVLPFPEESIESVSVGRYVQDLLGKESYCELILPRIHLGLKKTIETRLLLYDQFRRRYAANQDCLDAFKSPGVPVEICLPDGDWVAATTTGSPARQCLAVPVQLAGGESMEVSIGMIIRPSASASSEDLTRSRGADHKTLIARYNEKMKGAALATGKEYCKPIGGGARIASQRVVPITRGNRKTEESSDEEQDDRTRQARKRRGEHDERLAEITKKYCAGGGLAARGAASASGAFSADVGDAPERLRLG